MENRINIAELLKDCPTGMELDCLMYDNVYFKCIREHAIYPIVCYTIDSKGETEEITFNWCGKYALIDTAKCVIFPKGKTTWEGFHRPFKDGDIIYNRLQKKICIYYLRGDEVPCIKSCRYNESNTQLQFETLEYPIPIVIQDYRFATEEEKTKFFNSIKENGYKWNSETKTLEKLVIPEFKVGDKITNGKTSITIGYIDDEYYYEVGRNIATRLFIKNQDEWKLIPKRFDITTLKPFESKVLVRHNKDNKWTGSFFSFIDRDFHSHCYKFVTTADKSYPMMIPYKGNEYLLGKTDDCQDFYKTWE